MIRIKPEQDVTKRKVGVFRVYHLFQSSVFHISVCVCARVYYQKYIVTTVILWNVIQIWN